MNRDYKSGTLDSATFFIGKEVERTPVYGYKTLFVVGLQPTESIENVLNDPYLSISEPIRHIFFGANHSYNPIDYQSWMDWENMIKHFLDKNYFCSLDIPLSAVEEFNDGGLCDYDNFIPQIRVPIPYIRLWNYNTMIKIDDTGFNKSNPGIWTHSLHNLKNRENFTSWEEYKNDEVLK